ncbi:DUF2812 domain-containing protein [Undibacterium sp. Xuan67W]|uniref:DUF2812 domain-containing protein n=1 Tax=Undibacterium sp. Xuan67W TaxID=3413057 RepID=UPI003BF29A23
MHKAIVKKFKFHWLWQDDKLEQWLQEMASQGLHLQSVNIFCIYTFVLGSPEEVSYKLDFVTGIKRDEAYFDLFRDAGWEHVLEITGWQYWRKPITSSRIPEIFTDAASKIQKYKRALYVLGFAILPLFALMLNPGIHDVIHRTSSISQIFFAVFTVIIFLFYAYAGMSLARRIRDLKNNV